MANDFDESSANEEASKGLSWWYSADVLSRDKSDKTAKRIRRISITDRLLRHPGRLSMVYFGALIIIVTGLLLLPISTSDIIFTNFPVAFFTAVSALSTCGIPVVNTGEYWSMFGQVVVLFSIQFGGLGVMTFASMVALGASRRLKVSQRMLTANELGTTKLSEVKGVLTVVLGTSIIAEVLTFVLLLPDLFRVNHGNMGRTLWQALFYAVSAYNNTGFTPDATGLHVNRWGVGLPILISAFIGTLGFPVVLNLVQCARRRLSPKRWTLHTKLTLVTTAVLVATSLAWFLLVEWSNTGLFPADDPGMKMRRAMSAAVMPRSAGFDISWVPEVTNETKVFMSILMFIGAGSSSTAGGIRVTTFAVILLICRAAFTGHRDVTVFRRRIPRRIQMTAVSVTTACFALVMVGAMMLMFTTGCAFVDAVFEACSAFSLGGYSVGVASAGNPASLFILSAEMIVGRLGPLTIAYSISRPMAPECPPMQTAGTSSPSPPTSTRKSRARSRAARSLLITVPTTLPSPPSASSPPSTTSSNLLSGRPACGRSIVLFKAGHPVTGCPAFFCLLLA